MNMSGMNPAHGGPVGGSSGMIMMSHGTPATPSNSESVDIMKQRLNTYIYDYFLNFGYHDHARALVHDEKFEISVVKPMKSSPGGRRKEGEINGLDENAMDTDSKDDPLTLIPNAREVHFSLIGSVSLSTFLQVHNEPKSRGTEMAPLHSNISIKLRSVSPIACDQHY